MTILKRAIAVKQQLPFLIIARKKAFISKIYDS